MCSVERAVAVCLVACVAACATSTRYVGPSLTPEISASIHDEVVGREVVATFGDAGAPRTGRVLEMRPHEIVVATPDRSLLEVPNRDVRRLERRDVGLGILEGAALGALVGGVVVASIAVANNHPDAGGCWGCFSFSDHQVAVVGGIGGGLLGALGGGALGGVISHNTTAYEFGPHSPGAAGGR